MFKKSLLVVLFSLSASSAFSMQNIPAAPAAEAAKAVAGAALIAAIPTTTSIVKGGCTLMSLAAAYVVPGAIMIAKAAASYYTGVKPAAK